jgi:putative ABC transport system permease protein
MKDYFLMALKNVKNRKLRNSLTILGIIIGVAAIVALISISAGLKSSINEQFEKMGSNRFFVSASGGGDPSFRTGLNMDDVSALESLTELEWVNPYLISMEVVKLGREEVSGIPVMGLLTDNFEERITFSDWKAEKGRYLTAQDKYSVLIGSKIAVDGFDKNIIVNSNLVIKDHKFKVIGILEEFGNPQDDSSIFMPLDVMQDVFDKEDEVTMIDCIVKTGLDINAAAKKASKRLEKIRDEETFEIITPEQLLEQLGSILVILQVVLIGIAAISLVVGAIGILNSMYTSVLERTNEIGVMKAIGAKNSDIGLLFVFESGIIGFVGGIIGVLLGFIMSKAIENFAAIAGYSILKVEVSFGLMAFGLGFALIVGILSGALPAKKAAKLRPVEAMRYGK